MKVKVISKKESVIYNRNVYKFDDVLEMDNSVALNLVKRGYLEALEEIDDEIEEEVATGNLDPEQLKEMKYQDLRALAKEMELDATGTKEEIIERICAVEVGVEDEAIIDDENDVPFTEMPE